MMTSESPPGAAPPGHPRGAYLALVLAILCLLAGASRRASMGWEETQVHRAAYAQGATSRHPSAVRLRLVGWQRLWQSGALLGALVALTLSLRRIGGAPRPAGRALAGSWATLVLAGLCLALIPLLL